MSRKTIQVKCQRCGQKFYGKSIEDAVSQNKLKPISGGYYYCDCKEFIEKSEKKWRGKRKSSMFNVDKALEDFEKEDDAL